MTRLDDPAVKVVVERECLWCIDGYDWYPMMPGQRKHVCGICEGSATVYSYEADSIPTVDVPLGWRPA